MRPDCACTRSSRSSRRNRSAAIVAWGHYSLTSRRSSPLGREVGDDPIHATHPAVAAKAALTVMAEGRGVARRSPDRQRSPGAAKAAHRNLGRSHGPPRAAEARGPVRRTRRRTHAGVGPILVPRWRSLRMARTAAAACHHRRVRIGIWREWDVLHGRPRGSRDRSPLFIRDQPRVGGHRRAEHPFGLEPLHAHAWCVRRLRD